MGTFHLCRVSTLSFLLKADKCLNYTIVLLPSFTNRAQHWDWIIRVLSLRPLHPAPFALHTLPAGD